MNEAIAITLFGIGLIVMLIGVATIGYDIGKGLGYVSIGFVFLVGCFLTVYFKVM